LSSRLNPEHPLLGKELIALGMMVFGDNPFGWRFCNALYGVIGLYGAIRGFWWASLSRQGTVLFGLFLATNFIWFVLSRIAILDMAMAASLALAFWQWALAARKGKRVHLVLAGLFMGLSMGGKWNGVPLMVFPGLWYAWARWQASAGRPAPRRALAWLAGRQGGPVPGVCLLEAALWLGIWPVLVYFATFTPAMFYKINPLSPWHLIEWQQTMLKLQDSVVKPHRYMSHWYQWMANARPIWFFYEKWDGAQRGVLMIGNPWSMWAGCPRCCGARSMACNRWPAARLPFPASGRRPAAIASPRSRAWRRCSMSARCSSGRSTASRCSSITTTSSPPCSSMPRWRWS
jgi:hypothetical protein